MNPSTETPAAAPSAPSSRSALFIVFLVVFIDLLGFGIVLPMLSLFGKTYVATVVGVGPVNGMVTGLLMSSFSLMQFLFAPMWGRISDQKGRRPILLLGLFGSVVFYALFGFAASLDPASYGILALVLFFVARIGAGVAGATIATAQAVIADCTAPEKRKHGMALIGAAFGIGFTFGPLIGYFATTFFKDHPEAIGYTAAVISLVAFILGVILLPETRRFNEAAPTPRKKIDFSALRAALGSTRVGPIILVFFLATLGFAGFEVTLALLLDEVLHGVPANPGVERGIHGDLLLYFAYIGFVLLITQGFLYRRMAKRLSETTFMTIGIILMGGGVAALGGVTLAWSSDMGLSKGTMQGLLLTALTIAVMGFAFLTPSAQALISRRTDADHQGEILGVNQSASALARIVGPLLFLPLFMATTNHLLPYLFGAGVLLAMLPIMPRIAREPN